MPDILLKLGARMRTLSPLRDFYPTEANANDYSPDHGQYLGPHVDDRSSTVHELESIAYQREKMKGNAFIRLGTLEKHFSSF